MRTPLIISSLLVVTALVGCNNNRGRGGTTIRTPKPKPKADAGANDDSGTFVPPGCENNPMGCVEHQLLDQACNCLASCEPGWIFNGTVCIEDVLADAGFPPDTGTPPDSGFPPDTGTPPDSGLPPDTGVPPDSGVPPDAGQPECTTNAECGTGGVCLDGQTLEYCTGGASCLCAESCDPYATTSGCTSPQVCTWLGVDPNTPLGICLSPQGGGTHGQSCNTQYDANGNLTSDSCDRSQNHFCWGASPDNPIGVCTTLCGLNNPSRCSQLGNYVCDDLGDPSQGFGLCLEPRPTYTDLGNTCTAPAECQGNLCSQTLAGSCSASCGGLMTCPTGSYCLSLPQEGMACAQGCTHDGTTGDDAFCQSRNPNTVCENLGASQPIGICIPACMDNAQCGGGTCSNGHCI